LNIIYEPLFEREFILGIDPGYSGALAIINPKSNKLISVIDMPVTKSKTKAGKKITRIDIPQLSDFISSQSPSIQFAVIEDVGAMPSQGLVSTFNFGFGAGIIHGIVTSFMIPIFSPKPQIWKSILNLSRDKTLSVKKAHALFPQHVDILPTSKDGRAEAALLAYFGKRFIK
jgi:crossover junction endodeoxyribonuclease RuvC